VKDTNWERICKELVYALERTNIREYSSLLCNTRKFMLVSFLAGIFRGLGTAIGFSVLGAVALMILSKVFGLKF
jgi:hypothetical protein